MPELVLSQPAPATACARCGTEIAPGLLACPSCGRLVHAEELQRVAAEAEAAQAAGELARALELWRAVLAMIPQGTRQHETVASRVFDLEHSLPWAKPAQSHGRGGMLAGAGALALIGWKFKAILIFLLTKAKFLLFGLTKLTTVGSMAVSLGYYWARYGWVLAAGIIGSIYVHEMGHVWKLRKYGVPASAPMFIPGFGALIASRRAGTLAQEARIGLWGPLWGLAAPVAAGLVYLATGIELWAVVARWGAIINLFNLTPVWQLDGGHAFGAFSRRQRWMAGVYLLGLWFVTGEGTLVLPLAGCVWQLFRPAPEEGDRNALLIYLGLAAAFSAFALLLPGFGLGSVR